MRHQTTAYDRTPVARVRGARRKLRHELAVKSGMLLEQYRTNTVINVETCPLANALKNVKIPDGGIYPVDISGKESLDQASGMSVEE